MMNSYQPSEAQRQRVRSAKQALISGGAGDGRSASRRPSPLDRCDSGAVGSMRQITVDVPGEGERMVNSVADQASPGSALGSARSDHTPDSARSNRDGSVRFDSSTRFEAASASARASPGVSAAGGGGGDGSQRWESERVSARHGFDFLVW